MSEGKQAPKVWKGLPALIGEIVVGAAEIATTGLSALGDKMVEAVPGMRNILTGGDQEQSASGIQAPEMASNGKVGGNVLKQQLLQSMEAAQGTQFDTDFNSIYTPQVMNLVAQQRSQSSEFAIG